MAKRPGGAPLNLESDPEDVLTWLRSHVLPASAVLKVLGGLTAARTRVLGGPGCPLRLEQRRDAPMTVQWPLLTRHSPAARPSSNAVGG